MDVFLQQITVLNGLVYFECLGLSRASSFLGHFFRVCSLIGIYGVNYAPSASNAVFVHCFERYSAKEAFESEAARQPISHALRSVLFRCPRTPIQTTHDCYRGTFSTQTYGSGTSSVLMPPRIVRLHLNPSTQHQTTARPIPPRKQEPYLCGTGEPGTKSYRRAASGSVPPACGGLHQRQGRLRTSAAAHK